MRVRFGWSLVRLCGEVSCDGNREQKRRGGKHQISRESERKGLHLRPSLLMHGNRLGASECVRGVPGRDTLLH